MTPEPIDPIFTEILSNYLVSAAEEMTAVMVRAAYSTAIRDRRDCSAVLLTSNAEIAAQAADVPIHLGGLIDVARRGVTAYGIDRLKDGDVLIANDPYCGASSHLNDISAVCPIWFPEAIDQPSGAGVVGREPDMYACVSGHHADVGGRRPGSESVDSTSIFQEGLRLPCLLAYRDGHFCPEILQLVELNSRTPFERAGDLRAQIGAVLRGRARVLELTRKYGAHRVGEGIRALLAATEQRFRQALAGLQDGDFEATEELDPERCSGTPVIIRTRIQKHGEGVRVDFAGTSDQIEEGRNVPWTGLLGAVYYAMRALVDPTIAANSGFFEAIRIEAPPGSLVNAQPPAGVSTRVSTAQHIAGVMFKAVSSAWPDRVVAGCDGRRKVIFSGVDPRTGRYFVYHESNAGGVGAHLSGDGLEGSMAHVIQMMNLPIEVLEVAYPLRILRLELIVDSGGAGRWRGGAGVRRDYLVLADEVECTLGSERSNARMWGLAGGLEGGVGRFVVDSGTGGEWEPDSSQVTSVTLRRGQTLSVYTAGGGGYGDPRERPAELVIRDVMEGRVSVGAAERLYGVTQSASPEARVVGRRV